MDDISVRTDSRPTVGQMIVRDVVVWMAVSTPAVLAFVMFFMSNVELEDPSEAIDLTGLYLLLVADIGISSGMIYWRWSIYSSVLQSGVETPGEVTSVTRTGDTMSVEWTYRWQAETVKSSKIVGGFIPKRRLKYEVGLKATLLVDPNRPQRFLVLDTVR
jgi:hypothetical protein